jgi:hypothetical protein
MPQEKSRRWLPRSGVLRNFPSLLVVVTLLFTAVGALLFVKSVYYVATLSNKILLGSGAVTVVAVFVVLIHVLHPKDFFQIAGSVATILAVFVAAIAIWQSARTFEEQTSIQADLSAHNATQDHMQLRVDHSKIRAIEAQLEASPDPPKTLRKWKDDKPKQFTLYVTTAEHGIAMAEHIYKLADGDEGWKQTAQSWVQTYRPFLLGDKLYDCRDWHRGFIRFVDRKLDSQNSTVDRIDFCYNLWKQAQSNRP